MIRLLILLGLNCIPNVLGVFWTQENVAKIFNSDHLAYIKTLEYESPQCIHEYESFIAALSKSEEWAQISKAY